jgi:hypothetical protein
MEAEEWSISNQTALSGENHRNRQTNRTKTSLSLMVSAAHTSDQKRKRFNKTLGRIIN